jgi:hypothetical protein
MFVKQLLATISFTEIEGEKGCDTMLIAETQMPLA